jgi:hypothetical protein
MPVIVIIAMIAIAGATGKATYDHATGSDVQPTAMVQNQNSR